MFRPTLSDASFS